MGKHAPLQPGQAKTGQNLKVLAFYSLTPTLRGKFIGMKSIRITNAWLHNLKHISLDIPRLQWTAVTGISGSGKSTLAFDLIYEHGRRRYLQSIGMLADLAEDEGCEHISGLGPTIAVQQGIIRQSNPRSSVGTRSGIFTLLCMLFVYDGRSSCLACGGPVRISEPCPQCGSPALGVRSGYFSYNSPLGMCLRCQGRGSLFELNMEQLLPSPQTTMRQLLARADSLSSFNYLLKGMLKPYADIPFGEAPPSARQHILYGICMRDGRPCHNLFEHLRWKLLRGRDVNGCMIYRTCPDCGGYRVSADSRRVTLLGCHIGQLSQLTLAELEKFFENLKSQPEVSGLSKMLARDILILLHNLCENGLSHLTLYRELPSLSGGELQRLFLSTHISSELDSLIYILDEPTVGLHEVEKRRLIAQLKLLQSQGNTILVVEHDPHLIAAADHVIDIGPLAGNAGGEVVYQGDHAGLLASPRSVTGQYLSGRATVPAREKLLCQPGNPALRMSNVSTNNLLGVEVLIPVNRMVGVAGVSGSGKSSLVMRTLVPLLQRHFERRADDSEGEGSPDIEPESSIFFSGSLEGTEHIRGFYAVSQQPIGRHENSNPATYLKIWDPIRKLFAGSAEARALRFSAGHFSFNASGACPACSGSGKKRIWLGGPLVASQVCPACQGKRFQPDVLSVRLRGKTILDVLEMTAAEAVSFFAQEPAIVRVLDVLVRSGMGYLPLGQPAPTLSGGEAQRLKLANEISRSRTGKVLYLLDEPTIGLSLYDTGRLLQLLDELVIKGNTVLVIEHDPAVLSNCDWIIELGPGGGNEGGQVIATGSPADLKSNPSSIVGSYLYE